MSAGSGAQPRDLRAPALGVVAWAAMWLATSGEPGLWGVGVGSAAALGAAAAVRRSWLLAALALLAVVCLAAGVGRAWALSTGPVQSLAEERAVVRVEVEVSGGGRYWPASGVRSAAWSGQGQLVTVSGRGQSWRGGGPVELWASGADAEAWAGVPLGAVVAADARLGVPERGEGVTAVVRATGPPTEVGGPGPIPAAVQRVRDGLRAACAQLPPDARALVPALVVGDTAAMTDDLTERFRTTGLTHLTAVSGSNLTLMLAFLRVAAVAVGVRGRALTAVLVVGVAGFVLLCLGEPSVVRAAAMGLVGVVALGWSGAGRHGLHHLGVAVLVVVLIDPWLARSIGFCLSVLASLGLLLWAGSWTDTLAGWLPRWAAEAVAVPLAAQVATEPVVVALAGQVSVVGVLANAIVGPLVGPATVLGLLAAALSVVWPAGAAGVAELAGWCAQGIAWVASLGAVLPGAAVPWPLTPWSWALVVASCAVAVWLARPVLARRWLTLGLGAAVVVALLRVPVAPGWPPQGWSVVFCDVGQGDATVLAAGMGRAVVVDAGPDPVALERCLGPLGVVDVPLVVLTHLHADHVAGVAALARRRTAQVLRSSATTPESGDRLVRQALPDATQVVAQDGSVWQVGSLRLEVLAAPASVRPDAGGEGESSGENDASLLLRASLDGLTVLLAGDAEVDGQRTRARLGPRLDADVLLVPHHGSARQDADFLAAATPAVAVVSVGEDNDHGHPAERTLQTVAGLGASVFRTDLNGSVAVTAGPAGLSVTTER